MVLRINKNKSMSEFIMKCFIFITVFYSFFTSLCNRWSGGSVVSIVLAGIVILGLYFTHQIPIYKKDIAVCLGFLCLCILNCLLFQVDFDTYVNTFLFCCIPMIVAGGIIDFKKYHSFIYWMATAYIGFLFLYMVLSYTRISTVSSDYIDYLGFAYYAIPSLLIIIYKLFETRSKVALMFTGIGCMYLLICGTRGPMLCVFTYIVYCMLKDLNRGNLRRKVIVLSIIVVSFLVFINLKSIAEYLYPIFKRNGYSTRFLLFFMREMNIGDLTGRDTISKTVINSINEKFVVGNGLMGDRKLFGNEKLYSHNFVLEVFNSFGVPIGSVLLLGLFTLIGVALKKTKSSIYRNYIVIYVVASVEKLLISSTFMQETTLFLLIGICFAALRAPSDIPYSKARVRRTTKMPVMKRKV